jgi:hypothetical protein
MKTMSENAKEDTSMRRFSLCIWMGILVWSGLACFGGPPPDTVAPVSTGALVFGTDRLVIGDSVREVVRDRNRWDEVWALALAAEPSATLPAPIDFGDEMVLVAAAGRMDTGAQIRIDSVGVRGEDLIAHVVTIRDCRGFTSDVYPLVMVRVDRTDRRVRWIERSEQTQRCR